MDIINLNTNELLNKLNTSIKGLSNEEANKRIKKYGKNSFNLTNNLFKCILFQIFKPTFLILVISLISTIIIKNYYNSIITSFILLLNIIFNTLLDYKNEYPIILEKITSGKVLVIRNGKKTKIRPKNLTIGDIMVIEKNTIIKADIKVIVENNIKIESPLNNNYNEKNNILYAGDYVLEGSGLGIVFSIGNDTKIYNISKKTSIKKKIKLPFKEYINKLNTKISIFSFISIFLLILILYLKEKNYIFIINQVSTLIISITPISSIVIIVFLLYFNKKKIKNVAFNSLISIPSLGNISTIILNKNFFTVNELTAKTVELEDGSIYEIEGDGYNYDGEIIPINLSAKYKDSLYYLGLIGKLASLGNSKEIAFEDNIYISYDNEIDIASIVLNHKINHTVYENKIIQEIKNDNYAIVFYKEEDYTKFCIKGNVEEIIKFYNNDNEYILNRYNSLKNSNYKVMGIFEGKISKSKNKKKFSEKDVKNLNFIGFIGFIKPLRENIKDLIKRLKKEGIRLIITDENSINSEAFGRNINFINKKTEIITKEDIEHNFSLGERIFDDFIKDIKIISNVDNDSLIKIIDSLKRQGEIVAFISNEIEDNYVSKECHISISENSSIKNSSDLTINNLENITNCINESKKINKTIDNITKYIFYCKITEILTIFISNIFNNLISISINHVIYLNLSIIILGSFLIKNNEFNTSKNYKWILFSILNCFLILLFALVTNKNNFKLIDVNNSVILLIICLQSILLFYYQNNQNSILNWKKNWKSILMISTYLLIILIIFKFIISMSIINISIILGIILIVVAGIEIFKKSRYDVSK